MTGPYFVDANVLVYARDPRDPVKHKRAAEWIDLLWRENRCRTSIQAISEFYAVSTRKFGVIPSLAWRDVERYLALRPLPIDAELLRQAHELELRHRLSWWDSMIVAAAQRQACEVLLTEDLHDGASFGSLVVRSPFTLEARQPSAPYQVVPVHRPRGRPRKAA